MTFEMDPLQATMAVITGCFLLRALRASVANVLLKPEPR